MTDRATYIISEQPVKIFQPNLKELKLKIFSGKTEDSTNLDKFKRLILSMPLMQYMCR